MDFLSELKAHNSLDWMAANKKRYNEAKAQFAELIQRLIIGLSESDSSIAHLAAKDLIFRLNRDTRFSHDKSPYNPSFRAHISSAGCFPIPVGYYINVTPGNIFLGGGLFAPQFSDATAQVRDYIVLNGGELQDVLKAPEFAANFSLSGEKLKNTPRGYEQNHKYAEYLKHKSWDIEYHIEDIMFSDMDSFVTIAVNKFILMQPFNDFFNKALSGYKMPERKTKGAV